MKVLIIEDEELAVKKLAKHWKASIALPKW